MNHLIQFLYNDVHTFLHKLDIPLEKKQLTIWRKWLMLFMKHSEQISSQQVLIEVTHIKKIPFQKAVNRVDGVLENESLSTNFDWLQIYEKLQMKRNSCQNIRNIMTDYMIMHIFTDFIRVTKMEENLMDIIQSLDTGDIYEPDWQLNYTKKILHLHNM